MQARYYGTWFFSINLAIVVLSYSAGAPTVLQKPPRSSIHNQPP